MKLNISNQQQINKVRELIGLTTGIVQRVKRLDDKMAQVLMEIYGNTLNRNFTSSVHEEAIAAIGEVANAIGGRFTAYLQVAAQMISVGLDDGHQHPNLCSVAVLVLGDVALACKEQLSPYGRDFIALLLKNLKSAELPFELKPRIVETIGDVAQALGAEFDNYIEVVMTFLIEAGASNPGENPSQDIMKEINTLRTSVLGCILAIFPSLGSKKKSNKLILCFGAIIDMIQVMNQIYPSKQVVYLSLCVLEDMIQIHPQQAFSNFMSHRDFMSKFLEHGVNNSDTNARNSAERIQKAIMQLMSNAR